MACSISVNNESPSEKTMESVEDAGGKSKLESPPADSLSLITPVSEERSLPTPLEQGPVEATAKVNLLIGTSKNAYQIKLHLYTI